MTIPLDLSSADRMSEALSRVSQVKRVPVALARKYGLYEDEDFLSALEADGEGAVDIPCWRHAVINFPHPLLQQGLVILDTPGLNAIGTEPELTLNLLPNAHAVLFILAADAGVTKTDLEVWNKHLAGEDAATRAGRIVILNKIDGLWDELRSEPTSTPRSAARSSRRRSCSTSRRRRSSRSPRRRRCSRRSTATTRCSRRADCRFSRTRCRASSFPRSATSSAPRRSRR